MVSAVHALTSVEWGMPPVTASLYTDCPFWGLPRDEFGVPGCPHDEGACDDEELGGTFWDPEECCWGWHTDCCEWAEAGNSGSTVQVSVSPLGGATLPGMP